MLDPIKPRILDETTIAGKLQKWFERYIFTGRDIFDPSAPLLDDLIAKSNEGEFLPRKLIRGNKTVKAYQEYIKNPKKTPLSKELYAQKTLKDIYENNKSLIDDYAI